LVDAQRLFLVWDFWRRPARIVLVDSDERRMLGLAAARAGSVRGTGLGVVVEGRGASPVGQVSSFSRDDLLRSARSLIGRRDVGDAALVRAALGGSEEAVAALFERHWDGGYRTALLVTGDPSAAEDIAQEAFLAALRALPRFDLRRPLRPWLHRIVVNRAIDWSRARALRHEVGVDAAGEVPAGEPARQRVGDVLESALMRLPIEQRAVVVLRYVLELTPGEIAQALDLPRGTVNSRLRRGLDALGEFLEEEPR
jgi:RNA polymerase sigma-70 factor (ECF subfamily)